MPTNRLQVTYLRTPAQHEEDVAVTTHHFSDAAGGLLGTTEMATVEAAYGTFWNTVKVKVPPYVVPAEFRWYDQQVWPTPSPLLRVTSAPLTPGTALGTVLPPQCCCSITNQTGVRARWGRFYLPAIAAASLVPDTGRIAMAEVDAIATAYSTFVFTCRAGNAFPVVWSPRGGKGPPPFSAGTTLPVTSIRVDDIVDIVRSRRWQDSPYHHVVPIT